MEILAHSHVRKLPEDLESIRYPLDNYVTSGVCEAILPSIPVDPAPDHSVFADYYQSAETHHNNAHTQHRILLVTKMCAANIQI